MKSFEKDKINFINKGYLIKKAESKKSLKYISDFLKKRLINEIKLKKLKEFSFDNLHKYIEVNQLNSIRLKLIKDINQNSLFRKHLFFLAKQNLYEMVGNELAMQNNINLSIQFPNDESSLLPLHADTWSGDSPFETVLWLPLVNCYKTKSMFILDQKKYKKFTDIYKKKEVNDVSSLFMKLKKDFNFIKINYGNYLFFNQSLPHGNIINKTKETRISINCRFKGLFTPYAEKKLGKFFSPLNLRPASQIGLKYKFPGE